MFGRSTARLYWARFENAYYLYAFTLVKAGRVPASREVVLAEARESAGDVFELLTRKRSRLVP